MRAVIRSMRWTILIGMVAGVALSMLTPMAWLDSIYPVVSMRADVVAKQPTEVVVRLSGTKNRDCKYLGIDAFSRHGEMLRDLNMERIDMPADGGTKPKGHFDFGTWRIWPTSNTKLVMIYVRYDCSGRDVFVNVAEVAI